MSSNPFDRFVESFRRSDTPFTMFLLLTTVSAFVLSLFGGTAYLMDSFAFIAPGHMAQPWRLFTYPILNFGIVNLLFDGLALWWFGGSLERAWSTRGYAAFWLAASAISAISMSAGAVLFHVPQWVGVQFPLAAIMVAWAMLNPELTLMIQFIIPVKAKYVAVGATLILFFTHTAPGLLMGFFALGGCAFAYWWTLFFARTSSFTNFGGSKGFSSYPSPPRKDTFFGQGGAPMKDSDTPKRPKKILTPLDDKRTWKDWGPLAAYQRYHRRKQFERLLDDE